MRTHTGKISEIQLEPDGSRSAWIACPPQVIPASGQYVLGWTVAEILATPLFAAAVSTSGFLAAPSLPAAWQPGLPLHLRGPLGHGFRMHDQVRRLALAAFDRQISRLLPLAEVTIARGGDVALCTNASTPHLPLSFELFPLSSLPEILPWADLLALDIPLEMLPQLRACLGLEPGAILPCPAQALVVTPMPCGSIAECGACAVPACRGWKLACQDGPVFDLKELDF